MVGNQESILPIVLYVAMRLQITMTFTNIGINVIITEFVMEKSRAKLVIHYMVLYCIV